jgi:hypothetical protein
MLTMLTQLPGDFPRQTCDCTGFPGRMRVTRYVTLYPQNPVSGARHVLRNTAAIFRGSLLSFNSLAARREPSILCSLPCSYSTAGRQRS